MSRRAEGSVTRRGFLQGGAAGAALVAAGAPLFAGEPAARWGEGRRPGMGMLFGLQLYSVREDCAKDLGKVIAAVARMGYQGVEFAGYHGKSAPEIKKMLDDNGIVCCGTHTGWDTLSDANLAATIEFNKTLGNKYLIVPGLPGECTSSRQAWLNTAARFNVLAERVKPHGMRVGYHNHTIEFKPLEGEMPWDTFMKNTGKDVVMQLDTGNCMHGGADPLPFIYKYEGRAVTVHVKEYSKTNDRAIVGEGDINWRAFFALCRAVGGTEWYIVEQESYAYPPLECVEKCLVNLRGMFPRPGPRG